MVERIASKRAARSVAEEPRRATRRGGRRKGAGRRVGSVSEVKRVARARARMTGQMPEELLLNWARSGVMEYSKKKDGTPVNVKLDPSQRIQAANAAAPYYTPKLQPRPAPGATPPVYRVELDAAQLAGLPADMLVVFQKVLQMMARGMPSMADLAPPAPRADPAAYARTLRPDTKTEGRA